MRLYQLFDYLLSFSFEVNVFNGTEYVVVNDEVNEELLLEQFKKDNFCFTDEFINEKLHLIRNQLRYLHTTTKKGLDKFNGEDLSRSVFRIIISKFQEKGISFNTFEFSAKTKITYYLIYDLLDLLENRIEIVDAFILGYDYLYKDPYADYEISFSERRKKINYLFNYPSESEWMRIKWNKITWPTIKENYRFYFKDSALVEYERLFAENDIQSATKEKVRMFFKLLRDFGYFKYKLETEQLADLMSVALQDNYTISFLNKEKSGMPDWKKDYQGTNIPNLL